VGSAQKIKLRKTARAVSAVQVDEQGGLTFDDWRYIARFLQLINLQSSTITIGKGM
jgi:hypothetical protein